VVPLLLVASMVLFVALRVLPEDPAAMSLPATATEGEVEAARAAMGLDRNLVVQYALWLGELLSGELGRSAHLHRPVAALLGAALPASLELAAMAMLIGGGLGAAGGLLLFALSGAGARAEAAEAVAETGTVLLMSVPEFLWALLFILVFGVALEAMPVGGRLDPELARPVLSGFLLLDALLLGDMAAWGSAVRHMVLPAAALGIAFAPPVMRVLRTALVEVSHAGHIRQARLRGVSPGRVLVVHAMRLVALPVLAAMGVQFGMLFSGALLVEVIHGYPGLGVLMVDAVRNADLPVVQAVGLAYCGVVLAVGAVTDALCVALDPRLRP
jgi:peptide/nickel transport system permease protein